MKSHTRILLVIPFILHRLSAGDCDDTIIWYEQISSFCADGTIQKRGNFQRVGSMVGVQGRQRFMHSAFHAQWNQYGAQLHIIPGAVSSMVNAPMQNALHAKNMKNAHIPLSVRREIQPITKQHCPQAFTLQKLQQCAKLLMPSMPSPAKPMPNYCHFCHVLPRA